MGVLSQLLKKRSPVLHVLPPDTTVDRAVSVMAESKVGIVQVHENGKLIGVFSERDLLRRVVAKGLVPQQTELRAVMTPDPMTGTPGEHQWSAIQKMQDGNCRHLPIIDNGKVVDTLSMRDLTPREIRALGGT